ncbi:MAG: Asp-tRNA(Asn)/Glu-tRNA(Gln) amidotransferase subunit GatC [Chloroflexota bacterium]
MRLSREEVERIADLARLALSEEEIARYQGQLSAILEHFERLQELDTEGIPATSTVLALRSVVRDDELRPLLERGKMLENAPETEEGCFRVPGALE